MKSIFLVAIALATADNSLQSHNKTNIVEIAQPVAPYVSGPSYVSGASYVSGPAYVPGSAYVPGGYLETDLAYTEPVVTVAPSMFRANAVALTTNKKPYVQPVLVSAGSPAVTEFVEPYPMMTSPCGAVGYEQPVVQIATTKKAKAPKKNSKYNLYTSLYSSPTLISRLLRTGPEIAFRNIQVSNAEFACNSPGYILEGQQCKKVTSAPVKFKCPPGFMLLNDRCVHRLPATETISEITDITRLITPELTCPPNTTLNGRKVCEGPAAPQGIESCPRGTYRDSAGRCMKTVTEKPIYFCPPGFVLDGNKCFIEVINNEEFAEFNENIVEVDRSVEFIQNRSRDYVENVDYLDYYEVECGPNETHCGHSSLDIIEEEQVVDYVTDVSYDETVVRRGLARVVEDSSIEVIAAPEMFIGEEDIFDKKRSVKVYSQPAEKVCLNGILKGKRCHVQVEVPKEYKCPTPLNNGLCLAYQNIQPILRCPRGYEKMVCPTNVLDASICKCAPKNYNIVDEYNRSSTNYVCPSEYVLNGSICEYETTPTYMCPVDFKLRRDGNPTCYQEYDEPAISSFNLSYSPVPIRNNPLYPRQTAVKSNYYR